MHIVEIFALAISMFLGLHFCFLPTGDKKSNLSLGLLLIQMALGYLNIDQVFENLPPFISGLVEFLGSPIVFSTLLLLYFFAISKTSKSERKKYRFIFVPLMAGLVFYLIKPLISPLIVDSVDSVFALVELLFSVGISILILILIKRHNKNILNYFSSLEKKQLNWLKIIIIINLSFFAIWMIDDGLHNIIGDNPVSDIISAISLYATLINALWIGFSSLRQPPIYPEDETEELEVITEDVQAIEHGTEDLELFRSVNDKIKDGQYYLNSSLTLRELSEALEIRDKELSRIINSCSDDNFYGYINSFRVEHFKAMLSSQEYVNLSILGMAMDSGFKNKSTFYAAFRKVEGMTPKEYQVKLSH